MKKVLIITLLGSLFFFFFFSFNFLASPSSTLLRRGTQMADSDDAARAAALSADTRRLGLPAGSSVGGHMGSFARNSHGARVRKQRGIPDDAPAVSCLIFPAAQV